MAENKKSFILYADLIKSIDHLTNEEKGILFNHLLEYVNDKNPILEDRLILTAWKPIEQQLKRDLKDWEVTIGKRSEAGKASAEAKKLAKLIQQTSTKSTSVESVQHTSTKSTDNVNVNVNVNVINNKEVLFNRFWELYSKKIGRKDCLNKFMKLSINDMEKIIQSVPKYVLSTPDEKFRKNPETYLNGRHWEDEIELTSTPAPKKQGFEYPTLLTPPVDFTLGN
jgi:hypothetical protein